MLPQHAFRIESATAPQWLFAFSASIVKVRDVLRWLADDGWVLVRTRGSHKQFKHPVKPGLVTIAGSSNDDLAPGTLNSILKQAGLKSSGEE